MERLIFILKSPMFFQKSFILKIIINKLQYVVHKYIYVRLLLLSNPTVFYADSIIIFKTGGIDLYS